MTTTMDFLFEYLDEHCVEQYLLTDPKYRISSAQTDAWALELPKHLDDVGKQLFEDYQQAVFHEKYCLLKAMFQATVALCRELNGTFLFPR